MTNRPDSTAEPSAPPTRSPRRRLLSALRPRLSRSQLIAAVLCAVLGFAAAVQVRLIDSDDNLRGARETDLIGILDNLTQRGDRLRAEVNELRTTRDQLTGGADQQRVAARAAEERLDSLGILAGTVPAEGPGIVLSIEDPRREVDAAMLLDAVQELRDAGAEAMQIGPVRVVASTYFVDRGNVVEADGRPLRRPYRITAIGDPRTMATALGIPGGVLEALSERGATGDVAQRQQLRVSALRQVTAPEYARPAPRGEGGAND